MRKIHLLLALGIVFFFLLSVPAFAGEVKDNFILKYKGDGYKSLEWFQERGDVVFPDIYWFETESGFNEVGIGGGWVFPLQDDYFYGFLEEFYLAGSNYDELWLESFSMLWGEEENWGFQLPVFQYFALNTEAYNYTFADGVSAYIKLGDDVYIGISSTIFWDYHTYSEDHGPFVEFVGTDVGTVRLSYQADRFEVKMKIP